MADNRVAAWLAFGLPALVVIVVAAIALRQPAAPGASPLEVFPAPKVVPLLESQSLQGHWSLIVSGYTRCPDICPATLATVKRAFGGEAPAPTPQLLFVSVDPRDDPATLRTYLDYFDPGFHGITAHSAPEFVQALGFFLPDHHPSGDRVAHASYVALLDPRGRFVGVLRPPFSAADLRVAWQTLLASSR